jgi:hypothetical protein
MERWLGFELQSSWDWLGNGRFVTMLGFDVRLRTVSFKNSGAVDIEALVQIPQIGGLPHTEITLVFESASKLASVCREQHPSIVFVTPGLAAHAAELARCAHRHRRADSREQRPGR